MQMRPIAMLATAYLLAAAAPAWADDAPKAPEPPAAWIDTLKISGHVEAGVSGNPDGPANNLNFGQLFTDRANSFRVNQAMLTAERDLDPKATGYDFGFKLQGMYGTDSRFTHFFNEFDRVTKSPYQWDIVEANVQAHLPLVTEGGIDIKLGQYSTPIGAEVIDTTANPLYSHSYIFNYGLPLKHTGLLTTTHVNDTLDIWAGLDSGINASLGSKGTNNGGFPKGIVGFGLNNLLDGKLTVLALAHIGAENPRGSLNVYGNTFNVNSQLREIYDVVLTYKFNDSLTSITEFNRIHDDYYKATAGGVAQYLTYAFNDQWSVTGRGELFADQGGFNGFAGFVCEAPGSLDFVDGERGLTTPPNSSYCGGTSTGKAYNAVYGAVTLGVTYKPPLPMGPLNLTIRPEIRYDSVVAGSNIKPFNVNSHSVGTQSGQFTAAVDFILAF